ncbi:TolC family protein [Clostridium sp. CX1]|uniref:TolC family protein n=1 Tax=Clostridium sp. CX1 TaxID=2978346 RepID=UPI0021C1B887|nr:TolC family protein [Clostridium sp. CX1]MCT8978546.1 TolC family protein [Clostridium sp. CX1]
MKKKLSFLIALAISLSVNTAAFADAAIPAESGNINTISTSDTINLTLEDALNSVEKNNTELKLMKDKINSLNKQFDIDHNYATTIDTNKMGSIERLTNQYLQAKMLQEIVPLNDVQKIKDAKNSRDERINVIKFDLQRHYLNVLNSRSQIDNINKTIANIDEKIKQTEEKIKVGQATANSLDPLNVQKSQLYSQIRNIEDQTDQSLLTIKQYLNIDLNKNLNLSSVKKDFVKIDDKDIASKINEAASKDYTLSSLKANMDIVKKQNELYSKYSHNAPSGENTSKSTLAGLQTQLITVNTGIPQTLWNSYYSLKSKENAIQTQILTEQSAQDAYDKAKKNFEVGMTDKVTVDSAALELDKQKSITERTVNEYMVAQEEFKYMLEGHSLTKMPTQSMGVSGIGY